MSKTPEKDSADLPDIPVMDQVCTIRDVFDAHQDTAESLADCFNAFKPMIPLLKLFNRISRKWLEKVQPDYSDDVVHFAENVPNRSVYALNLSYEWACTTTAFDDVKEGGVKMFRTLDWGVGGMGDKFVLAKHEGPAGEYWNVAYPGYAGVLTGMAEGRFSIAINQAPVPRTSKLGPLVDWIRERKRTFKSDAMPAPFLLRKVFEECANYDEAVKTLSQTPLATSAIFTVAGTKPGEHCVIERSRDDVIVNKENVSCAANHWINDEWKAWARPFSSHERRAQMVENAHSYKGDFDWVKPPVENFKTRLAVEANAKNGTMKLVGMEGSQQVTKVFELP